MRRQVKATQEETSGSHNFRIKAYNPLAEEESLLPFIIKLMSSDIRLRKDISCIFLTAATKQHFEFSNFHIFSNFHDNKMIVKNNFCSQC